LTNENHARLTKLAKQKDCTKSNAVNQIIAQYAGAQETEEILQSLKQSQYAFENKANMMCTALNNFLLHFAGGMDGHAPPEDTGTARKKKN
jgi:hypothetical protein